MTYKEAEKLAQSLSLDNANECFYVNWLEGYEYCVDSVQEVDDQPYYLNGCMYYDTYDVDNHKYKTGEEDDNNP